MTFNRTALASAVFGVGLLVAAGSGAAIAQTATSPSSTTPATSPSNPGATTVTGQSGSAKGTGQASATRVAKGVNPAGSSSTGGSK